MSTRSGRRIHGSVHEPEVQVDAEQNAECAKKTRSKRLKDNNEVLETTESKSKKRNNYVSYPSDEESLGVSEITEDKKDEPVRGNRKTVLKEQNLNISLTDTVDVVDNEKPVRQTRRTRRFVEDEPEVNAEKEAPDTITLGEKKGKKNKKKKIKKEVVNENEVAVSRKSKRKKKSTQESKNSTLNKSNISLDSFHSAAGSPVHGNGNNILNATSEKSPEKMQESDKSTVRISDRKRQSITRINDQTSNLNLSVPKANTPSNKRAMRQNSTFEITNEETKDTATKPTTPNRRLTLRNSTFDVVEVETKTNSTFEKEKRRSSIKNGTFNADSSMSKKADVNSTFDKNKSGTPNKLNTTFEKESRVKSLRLSSTAPEVNMNSTYEKDDQQPDVLNLTFDKETKLNSTFEKKKDKSSSNKSSLLTSDDTSNLTFDKSVDRISITSDDSRIENTTPVLIESSFDESCLNKSANKQQSPIVSIPTPLKREGTFTKEGPEVESKTSIESNGLKTPTKRISIATPGSTPFPFFKSGQKERAMVNVTRSLEKSRLSVDHVDPAPRMTRVMFCSPVNNPAVVAQQKRKVIKSNLKGSNKSFVFEETASPARAAPRKRSYTHNDVEARAKRSRLNDDQQQSVDRLSRPRSSTTKPNEPTTPSKRIPTPSKSKSETKVSRTKLPNFAALHQRRFDKMESLDECQERKAKRAKQLLIPSAAISVLERSSPRVSDQMKAKEVKKHGKPEKKPEPTRIEPKAAGTKDEKKPEAKPKNTVGENKREVTNSEDIAKTDTAKSMLTLDTLKRGYTRFGFKMNIGINPFSVPRSEVKVKETNSFTVPRAEVKVKETNPFTVPRTEVKVKEKKNGITREVSHPSLVGATITRKEAAKQIVMREKSFTQEWRDKKRKESRTVIRGVRTNRRFELQMQMRNIS